MSICLMIIEDLAGETFCPGLPIGGLCHGGHFQLVAMLVQLLLCARKPAFGVLWDP